MLNPFFFLHTCNIQLFSFPFSLKKKLEQLKCSENLKWHQVPQLVSVFRFKSSKNFTTRDFTKIHTQTGSQKFLCVSSTWTKISWYKPAEKKNLNRFRLTLVHINSGCQQNSTLNLISCLRNSLYSYFSYKLSHSFTYHTNNCRSCTMISLV